MKQNFLNEKRIIEENIFNYSAIKSLINQLESSNPGDAPARLWALIVFNHWYSQNKNNK